jgi:hypothetical protein
LEEKIPRIGNLAKSLAAKSFLDSRVGRFLTADYADRRRFSNDWKNRPLEHFTIEKP